MKTIITAQVAALFALAAATCSAGSAVSIPDLPGHPGILLEPCSGVAEAASLLQGQEPTPEDSGMKISIGGGLQFGGIFAERNDYDVFAGLGFFGIALVGKDLAPGKPFPVPAVGMAEVEFFFAPGKNSISDLIYTGRVGFGINLLHMKPGVMLFPYAAVGLGFETMTGTLDLPVGSRGVAQTRFILPFEAGAGFSIEIKPGTSLFARVNFSFPLNAANVSGYFRAQFGVLIAL